MRPAVVDDEVRQRLIRLSWEGLPLVEDPYGGLARRLGLTAGEVVEEFRRLLAAGVVRRMAAVVDQRRVGLDGNVLVAWEVPGGRLDEVGEHLARYPQVSHCYLRAASAEWPYNIYAMVHGPDEAACRRFIEEVTAGLALPPPVVLPTVRELKRAPLPPLPGP